MRRLSRGSGRLAAVYACTLAVYALLRFTGDLLPPVTLLRHFEPWIAGGALLLLPFAILKRQPRVAGILGLGAVLGVGLYAPVAMQALAPRPAPPADVDFSVTTWNAGLGRATPSEVCAALSGSQVDVVVLQELEVEHFRALVESLSSRYPYSARHGEGKQSMAVLSTRPLVEPEWVVPERGYPWIRFSVDVDGTIVGLVGIHLNAVVAALSRYAPAHDCLPRMVESLGDGPSLLVGDFNMTPGTGEALRLAERGFTDAFAAVGRGFGFTFPVFAKYRGLPVPPMVRIDHFWSRGGLEPLSIEVEAPGGSDHLAVTAAFGLEPM